MEPSIFFKHRGRQVESLPPVTFLLIEVLANMQDELEDKEALEVIQLAAYRAGLVDSAEELDEVSAIYLLQRLRPPEEPGQEAPPPASQPSRKRAFGTEFLIWFEKLSLPEKCLYASDYDFEKARLLYCTFDKEIAEQVIKQKLERDMAKAQMDFEAVVFGMGGSFGKGSGGSKDLGEVVDHAKAEVGDPAYLESAFAFMNMQNSYRRK